jgi:DNA-binding CsgD family transcriptional regulator
MRQSTERLIEHAPALRKPDEVLDMLQSVSLKHPQRLKVVGASCLDRYGPRDFFFHHDFPSAQYVAEYQSLRQKHGHDVFTDYACSVSHSFTLSEAMHALQLIGEARWTFDFLAGFGLRDCFFVPHGHWIILYAAEQPLRLERGARFQLAMAANVAIERMEQFTKAQRPVTDIPELSDRQLVVLRLFAQGLTADEIAGQLHIGVGTVRNYVRRILEKMSAHSIAHAVNIAWMTGIFDRWV